MSYYKELQEKKISLFLCKTKETKNHSHSFLELAYVLKGNAVHKLDNSSTVITEGDYFVIDYNSHHSYESMSQDFEIINCLFLPEFIDSSFADCYSLQTLITSYQIRFNSEFFTASPSSYVYKDDNGKARSILLDMLYEFDEQAPGYIQILRSKIVELLIITMRKIYFNPSLCKENSHINNILACISKEYMNNLTLGELCKKFGYSFTYLSAKFKKETGMNFTEYLQKTRIEQSMRLLSYTDKQISLIAFEVGYMDIKSYQSVFKKVTGTTPAKFRKEHHICAKNA